MYKFVAAVMAFFTLVVIPGQLLAQDQDPVVQEIRAVINATYAYAAENLEDQPGGYSAEGALEFWSSGGLVQNVPPDSPVQTYESFNLVPKYIWVVSLAEDVAMAQFYVEGSFQPTGQPPVDHYFTRATEIFVRENGEWMIRGSHWSPVVGGRGTPDTAVIR